MSGEGDVAPQGLRELIEAVGLEPLSPLLTALDTEMAGFVAAPPADPEDLAEQAHGLVGAAGGLGFLDVADSCRELERACRAGRDVHAEQARVTAEIEAARQVIAHLSSPSAD